MTTTTQIAAQISKGTRLNNPKPKGKPQTEKGNTQMKLGSCKRAAKDSDDKSEQDDVSLYDDSRSAWRAKKAGKWQHVEPLNSEELERVDNDLEEVDDGIHDEQPPVEQEVSPYHLQDSLTHHIPE